MYLLIFYLPVLPIIESGTFKSLMIIVDIHVSPCSSIRFCFRYSDTLLLGGLIFGFLGHIGESSTLSFHNFCCYFSSVSTESLFLVIFLL